jgi:hypothetical protein
MMPGERLERGIQNVYVLGEDEGVILRATESFKFFFKLLKLVKCISH